MKRILPFLLFVFFSSALFSLENSIVPQIEILEAGKEIDSKKYTARQYEEILSALARKKERIRIVTYNLLLNIFDGTLEEPYKWPKRLPRVVKAIEEMQPDIMGVQEVYTNQRDDLMKALPDKYAFYSRKVPDGAVNGIFYNKHRFIVIDSHIYYLSDKGPNIPSAKTLTFLHLQDTISDQPVAFFNTHLSFSKIENRASEAKKIHGIILQFQKTHPRVPLIFTGDLNTFPNLPDHTKFPFYDGDYTQAILKKDLFDDSMEKTKLGHIGPLSTFTNKGENPKPFKGTGTPGVFLDHIYVSKEITVLIHAVNPVTIDGLFPSDHMPVIADIALPEKRHEQRTEQDSNL